mgnify:CR=1 FL=1
MIKSINWAPVLSFVMPGLGQIGLSEYKMGFLWFFVYATLLSFGIFYSYLWIIGALGIWILNILDAASSSYKSH